MIDRITKAYIREYSDNGQRTAYVEWIDFNGKQGRTEGEAKNGLGAHMFALLKRAERDGVNIEYQTW